MFSNKILDIPLKPNNKTEDLVTLLFVIILGISSYYLIFNKILEIN